MIIYAGQNLRLPGRVKLTPVAGQADTYDLTRADQPTQEGTPLNKAALLSDTTVSSWQSGYPWDKEAAAVTPDDACPYRLPARAGRRHRHTDATGKLMYDQIPEIGNTLDIEGGKGPSGSSPGYGHPFCCQQQQHSGVGAN